MQYLQLKAASARFTTTKAKKNITNIKAAPSQTPINTISNASSKKINPTSQPPPPSSTWPAAVA